MSDLLVAARAKDSMQRPANSRAYILVPGVLHSASHSPAATGLQLGRPATFSLQLLDIGKTTGMLNAHSRTTTKRDGEKDRDYREGGVFHVKKAGRKVLARRLHRVHDDAIGKAPGALKLSSRVHRFILQSDMVLYAIDLLETSC